MNASSVTHSAGMVAINARAVPTARDSIRLRPKAAAGGALPACELLRNPVYEEATVEMVHLRLDAARHQAVAFDHHRLTWPRRRFTDYLARPRSPLESQ